MKFVSKESPKFDIVAAILNSTQHPGRVFVMPFCPLDFVQKLSIIISGLWLLLSDGAILSQNALNSENDSREDSEVDNHWEKYIM